MIYVNDRAHDRTMKTLVTYAVEAEFVPWRALCDLEEIVINDVTAHRSQIGRATVDFVATGMGAENASRVAKTVISTAYSFCIASGFAGALKSSVRLGDVVVAEKVQRDGPGGIARCARNLVTRAYQDGAIRIATLLTADHVVNSAAEKQRLAPFAEAVDMESLGILREAQSKSVPAVAIRVISDSFDRDLPVDIDTLVDAQGNVRIGGVVRYVAQHPLVLPALVRLGRESKTAAQALANFLEAYIKKLSFATHGWPPPELQEVAAT
jgi:adenosylhomocysteine nucleosidase